MKKGKTYEVNIVDTEFPGLGVGMEEGKKVYIKGALPGQKVMARVTKERKTYVEANIVEILEEVPYKIADVCPHYGFCGGCSHQAVPYEKQLEFKEKQVKTLFAEAEIEVGEFLGIECSPQQFEYRNKMEFTFGDFEKGGELTLGMHKKGSPFSVITVDECRLIDEDYRKILQITLTYFKEKGFPYYRVVSHEGFLRNLVLRKGENTGEFMVNIVTTSQIEFDFTEYKELLQGLSLKSELTSVLHTINDSLSDTVQPDKLEVLQGREYILENILGLQFKISPFSFFQTNSKGAEKLYDLVRSFITDAENKVVFDLYCGTGTIGQIVAPKASKVVGIELIEEAVEVANENAKLNGLSNCKFIAGDIAKVITTIKEKPDLIILDPPRAGVHPFALDYVLRFNAPQIIYVSCNPKTLVVDLKEMIARGYIVEKVIAMDMFPHTPHVETVVKIERR